MKNFRITKYKAVPFLTYRVASDSCAIYYTSRFPNPEKEGTWIWVCSCPDFQIGRPSKGINPFADPCKHILEIKDKSHE